MWSGPCTSMKLLTLWSMKRNRGLATKPPTFSRLPVELLSMHTTWSPRRKKLSQRCEPRKPAPPVMRTLAIAPPYRKISKAHLTQIFGIVDISSVENNRLLQQLLDRRKVRTAELVPFRDDEQRVGALKRVVVAAEIGDTVAKYFFCLMHRLGVVRVHRRAGF